MITQKIAVIGSGISGLGSALILSEKQREDIRFQKAEVVKIGFNVKHVKEKDLIYFDKAAAHKIEIDKEPYHVIKQENVVVVL